MFTPRRSACADGADGSGAAERALSAVHSAVDRVSARAGLDAERIRRFLVAHWLAQPLMTLEDTAGSGTCVRALAAVADLTR